MRSIFDFISFPGIADQDGGSHGVPGFSIDYLQVEIVLEGSNAEAKKNENWKIFVKIKFHQFFMKFTANFEKNKQNWKKTSWQWLVEQDSIPRLEE